jgi:hypothetical protein
MFAEQAAAVCAQGTLCALKHIVYSLSLVARVTIIHQYNCWMSGFSLPYLLFIKEANDKALFNPASLTITPSYKVGGAFG